MPNFIKQAINFSNNKIQHKMFWGEGFASRLSFVFERVLSVLMITPGMFAPYLLTLAQEKIKIKIDACKKDTTNPYNGEIHSLLLVLVLFLKFAILIPLVVATLAITIVSFPFIAMTSILSKLALRNDWAYIQDALSNLKFNYDSVEHAHKIKKEDVNEMRSCTEPSCDFNPKNSNELIIKYGTYGFNKPDSPCDVMQKWHKESEIHIFNPKLELLSALYRTNFGNCRDNERFMHPFVRVGTEEALGKKIPKDLIDIINNNLGDALNNKDEPSGYHVRTGHRYLK